MHHIDTLATDIQTLCFHNKGNRIGHTDYTYTPQYIINKMYNFLIYS